VQCHAMRHTSGCCHRNDPRREQRAAEPFPPLLRDEIKQALNWPELARKARIVQEHDPPSPPTWHRPGAL
jgi:hypothetical protein